MLSRPQLKNSLEKGGMMKKIIHETIYLGDMSGIAIAFLCVVIPMSVFGYAYTIYQWITKLF